MRYEAARNAFALKMAALHDLSLDLSMADNVDELCRRAVILGQRVLGYDRIGIWFIDPSDPALLYGSYGTDEDGHIRDERGVHLGLRFGFGFFKFCAKGVLERAVKLVR